MREIKFRAWVLGKMYEVKNLEWDWGHLIITTDGGWIALPDPKAHLMEFTGLHDKNGVEIYEGDVIKTSLGVIAVVEWEKAGRFLGFTEKRELVYIGREPLVQVIGNIHETGIDNNSGF